MKVFIDLIDNGDEEPCFINILKIDFILRNKNEEKTKIAFSSGNTILTLLSPKEIIKKINIALGHFGDEEIIKK